jgi:hypothetical protein
MRAQPMPTAEEYRKSAEDCQRLANEAKDPKEREILMRMAEMGPSS